MMELVVIFHDSIYSNLIVVGLLAQFGVTRKQVIVPLVTLEGNTNSYFNKAR